MHKVALDPKKMDSKMVYKLLAGTIVPRPIALISTIGRNGVRNVAPFSFFNCVSHNPPLISVSIGKTHSDGRPKDTLTNLLETEEFVVNIVGEELASKQDLCAREYGAEEDEFAMSGLTPEASVLIRAPRVKESAVNFECRVAHVLHLPEAANTLVIGRIDLMHVRSDILDANGRIDLEKLAPIGRLVGDLYCRTSDSFTLQYNTLEHLSSKQSSG